MSLIACSSFLPRSARSSALTQETLREQFSKTGGTPYFATTVETIVDEGPFVPTGALNDLRRRLITELKEARAKAPERRSLPMPPLPEGHNRYTTPARIYQITQVEQLTPALAALQPDLMYIPLEIIAEHPDALDPFRELRIPIAAVLPRIITDEQNEEVHDLLRTAWSYGVRQAVVGNLGHIVLASRLGMKLRGDFGLNVFNSYTLDLLRQAGFTSVTASFELRMAQIRDLSKAVDTEAIVYGRLPCMITEQCVIKNSAGRCSCHIPNALTDRRGSSFPVVRAFGCRNVIFNAHKLYLADKHEDYETAGLWGARLLFTTETPHECVEVAKSYLGLTDYRPNGLTRGLYYRGVE